MKRAFDLTVSIIGLVLLSPLIGALALVIAVSSGLPILYRSARIGRGGVPFAMLKFRTMVRDAATVGPGITSAGDARITRVGALLRRTKLDELPQLINVIAGQMSLVGPRPEDPRYVALYTTAQRDILRERPGITSAASLVYRHEELMLQGPDWHDVYVNQVMPAKIAIDLDYAHRRSFWTDLGLIFRTVGELRR